MICGCILFLVNGKIDCQLSVGSTRWQCFVVLRKNVGDEVAKPFGVLLGVDRGDFSASLQQRDKEVRDIVRVTSHSSRHDSKHRRAEQVRASVFNNTPPLSFLFLSCVTHPVFDSFRCVSGFLLRVVLSEDIDQAHEVDLPLRSS